jgi:hypothetical protein
VKVDAPRCLPSGHIIAAHLLDTGLELGGLDTMPGPFLGIILRGPVADSLSVLEAEVTSAQRQSGQFDYQSEPKHIGF